MLIAVQYYYKRDTDAHTHTHTHTDAHTVHPAVISHWLEHNELRVFSGKWSSLGRFTLLITPRLVHRRRLCSATEGDSQIHACMDTHTHTRTHAHASAHMLPCTADNEDRIRHLKINMKCPE